MNQEEHGFTNAQRHCARPSLQERLGHFMEKNELKLHSALERLGKYHICLLCFYIPPKDILRVFAGDRTVA